MIFEPHGNQIPITYIYTQKYSNIALKKVIKSQGKRAKEERNKKELPKQETMNKMSKSISQSIIASIINASIKRHRRAEDSIPKQQSKISFPNMHGTVFRIDHILGYNASLNELERLKLYQAFFLLKSMRPEVNYKKLRTCGRKTIYY